MDITKPILVSSIANCKFKWDPECPNCHGNEDFDQLSKEKHIYDDLIKKDKDIRTYFSHKEFENIDLDNDDDDEYVDYTIYYKLPGWPKCKCGNFVGKMGKACKEFQSQILIQHLKRFPFKHIE